MRLTEDQRNKLMNRETISPIERRDNEFAVRHKLKDFLEFIPDANLILGNIPQDRLKKNTKLANVLNDQTTYGLFDLLFQLLNLLDFPVAYGDLRKPYAIKDRNYLGPFAHEYEAPITREAFEEREKIEAKIYPKLKQMTSEEYRRILHISIYIQELIDNYLSDLTLLDSLEKEFKFKCGDFLHRATLSVGSSVKRDGLFYLNARLIKILKEFSPITEKEIISKLFIDPLDLKRSKAIIYQLKDLEAFGIIRKEEKGWKWLPNKE